MSYTQIRGVRRRQRILDFLKSEAREGHPPPTVREIATVAGCSVATTYQHLRVLESTERISRKPYISRSVRVL